MKERKHSLKLSHLQRSVKLFATRFEMLEVNLEQGTRFTSKEKMAENRRDLGKLSAKMEKLFSYVMAMSISEFQHTIVFKQKKNIIEHHKQKISHRQCQNQRLVIKILRGFSC